MRKVVISKDDYKIETELSEAELSKLLGIKIFEKETIVHPVDNEHIDGDIEYQLSKKAREIISSSDLLLMNTTELKGRSEEEQSTYKLYEHKYTKDLNGLVLSKKKMYILGLGNTRDKASPISFFIDLTNSIHPKTVFTKNEFMRSLPKKISKGNLVKFGLDYLVKMGYIEKMQQEGSRSVTQYRKKTGIVPDSEKLVTNVSGIPTR